jgi:cyclohexanone monooxygenase
LLGIERFAGAAFHSAEWDHSVELEGKRVAVVGTGASSIQFVPQIAPRVRELHLYQRTPPWILPKPDREIPEWEHEVYRRVPLAQKLMRGAIYSKLEARVLAFAINPKLMQAAGRMAVAHIESQIASPELRRKVTPDYTMGCKRVLLSNDYYPALALPQVDVITHGIREVREHSIVADDGTEREVDAIIYGTGFKVQEVIARGMFFGRGGVDIADTWITGPEAYKGTSVSGFPNLFLILGPNTGLGHNSMVYMIESQAAYIMDALQRMRAEGWSTVDVKRAAQAEYNHGLQAKLGKAVWQTGCKSWYLDANGKNTALWPGFTFRFRKQTAEFDEANYVVERSAPGATLSDAAAPASKRTQEKIQEVA